MSGRVVVPELTKQVTVGEMDIEINKDFELMDRKYADRKDRWKLEMYPRTNYVPSEHPNKSWIEGLEPRETKILLEKGLSYYANYGDNYIGYVVGYVYSFEAVEEFFMSVITIEKGSLYINDELIHECPSNSWQYDVPFSYKKGWNKIELVYHAGGGTDGFQLDGQSWKGNGLHDQFPFAYMYYDKFDLEIETELIDMNEKELKSVSVKGYTKFNILGEDLWDDVYLMYDDALKPPPDDENGKPLWEMSRGSKGLRFKTDVDYPLTGTAWHWRTVNYIDHGRRQGLFKPNTQYTLTYYVNEAIKPEGAQIEYNIWIANSRWGLKQEIGLHTLTFTTDLYINRSTAYLLREMYCGPETIYNKGDRRVYDIEFISLVEGPRGLLNKSNCLPSIGKRSGFGIITQDQVPILGTYALEGDIPTAIDKLENDISDNTGKLNVTWF